MTESVTVTSATEQVAALAETAAVQALAETAAVQVTPIVEAVEVFTAAEEVQVGERYPAIWGEIAGSILNQADLQAALAALTLGGLDDVDLTGAVDGDALIYDAVSETWKPGEASTVAAINDLTDVNTTGLTNGQILRYVTDTWVPATLGSAAWEAAEAFDAAGAAAAAQAAAESYADGAIDALGLGTMATQASTDYLALTGGTLTGGLNGTTGAFSGQVTITNTEQPTGADGVGALVLSGGMKAPVDKTAWFGDITDYIQIVPNTRLQVLRSGADAVFRLTRAGVHDWDFEGGADALTLKLDGTATFYIEDGAPTAVASGEVKVGGGASMHHSWCQASEFRVSGTKVVGAQGATVHDVFSTVYNATLYGGNFGWESQSHFHKAQTEISAIAGRVNQIIARLKAHGLIA